MAAAADARGLKRICTGCGARFYDMNKRPIVCPSCDTEFTGEVKVRTSRGRAAAAVEDSQAAEKAKAPEAANDEAEDDTADVEVVSLDDAAEAEDANDDDAEDVADADLDLDALEADDDDDDAEDDLSGLEGDVDLSVASEKE